ncbi:MAG: DUF3108 domain-containing protein [Candidatus Zhuqueibacterota bacterium]
MVRKINHTTRLAWLLFLAIISLPALSFGQDASPLFVVGQKLQYRVHWMHIHLGTVTFHISDSLQMHDETVYRVRFDIDSNPMLFFVDIHNHYESYVDAQYRPHLYVSNEHEEEVVKQLRYEFNYAQRQISARKEILADSLERYETTIPLQQPVFEGMSLLFYLRNQVHQKKADELSIIENCELKTLTIENTLALKRMPSVTDGAAIEAYELLGHAKFASTAGLSGKFRIWVSNDAHRIPLKIELNVFLGKIKMVLEHWHDPNVLAAKFAE